MAKISSLTEVRDSHDGEANWHERAKSLAIFSAFTEGVSGSTTGTQIFTVPHEPSDTSLVYQCTIHGGMVGNLTIV